MMFNRETYLDDLEEEARILKISLARIEKDMEKSLLGMQPDPNESGYDISRPLDAWQYFREYIPSRYTNFMDWEIEKEKRSFTQEENSFRAVERETIENIERMNVELDAMKLNREIMDQEKFLKYEYEIQGKIFSKTAALQAENRKHEERLLGKEMHEAYAELKKIGVMQHRKLFINVGQVNGKL